MTVILNQDSLWEVAERYDIPWTDTLLMAINKEGRAIAL